MDNFCGKCSQKFKTKEKCLKCSGNCSNQFHINCVDVPESVIEMMVNCEGLKWFCMICVGELENMSNIKKEIACMQSQITTELTEFRNLLKKANNSVDNAPVEAKSYAKVAGEVVVIKPKEAQESKKTREAIQKHVKPAALEVGITEIKNIKEGGVLIKCKSKEEVERIKSVAEKKLSRNYKINAPQLKRPCVKVLDIDENLDSEKLINAIKKQNPFIQHESLCLEVLTIKKLKTTYMALIECDPTTFSRIMTEQRLCVNWSRCRVFEYVNIFRCFNCGGFNHKANDCKSLRCLKCADGGHKLEDCKSESYKCYNCMEANEKLKLNLDSNHSIYDNNCPVFQKKVALQKQKIKYTVSDD